MDGKMIIITGANRGIGFETARALARTGATLVLACRNLPEAKAAQEAIRRESGNPRVEVRHLDLASLASVRDFAERLRQDEQVLDVLINNAGTFSLRRKETEDGFEQTMGVNYLGPFLLTHLLLEPLLQAPGGRIVNLSSNAHFYGRIDLSDGRLASRRGWLGFQAYAGSKLALVLFTLELAERLEGTGVTANAVHPGHVETGIWPSKRWYERVMRWFMARVAISAEQGAETSVYLASSPEVEGVTGKYFYKNKPEAVSDKCLDPQLRRDLWRVSEELTGVGPWQGGDAWPGGLRVGESG